MSIKTVSAKWSPSWEGRRWFNISSPFLTARWRRGHLFLRLWNLYNRRAVQGHFWGFGILQINSRHLLYIGHDSFHLLFLGRGGE